MPPVLPDVLQFLANQLNTLSISPFSFMFFIHPLRKREEKEALDKLAKMEMERQMETEQREMIESNKLENNRRKKLLLRQEMVRARIASLNLQVGWIGLCEIFS